MSDQHGGETCWHLVGRAASGDDRARSRFCRTYLPLVRSFLLTRWRQTPLSAEVEDAVQDAFVECLREDGPLTRAKAEQGDFRGYLFGIVRHVAQRAEERLRRGTAGDQETESQIATIQSKEDRYSQVFDRQWARTLMREAGNLMRERAENAGAGARLRVELLQLRFGQNLPIRQIAAQWKMDPDAVHRAYAKARQEFRSCLRQSLAYHAVRTEADLDAECRRLFTLLE